MTTADEMGRNIGAALAEGKVLNPHKLWRLDPPKRDPEPNRRTLA